MDRKRIAGTLAAIVVVVGGAVFVLTRHDDEAEMKKMVIPAGANARIEDEPERLLLKARKN